MKRRRWQVDLRQEDELALERAKRAVALRGLWRTRGGLCLGSMQVCRREENVRVVS
jgi:hypothetical protein